MSSIAEFALVRSQLPPEIVAALDQGKSLEPELISAGCIRLRNELEALASHIPSSIVRRQIADPQPGQVLGGYWDGSILFADLSGFTALSGQLAALGKQGAEEVSAIINQLFAALVAEIYRYDGELLKFGGDAITAFFDARHLGKNHAARAARAALAMQERMEFFNAIQTRAGSFRLRLRVGVHSGQVFAAEVGDLTHIELVVTGRDINRVAKAQEIAEPGEVVVTRETLAMIPGLAAEPRDIEFFLITELPMVVPSSRLRLGIWEPRDGDIQELFDLALRVQALRPYLAYRLPQRYIEQSNQADLGEFRPVTVLFANFFPFSQILTLLGSDAKTAVAILNAYYQRAQATIHRYGGIVNKVDMYTHGDKLMALFGAPIAHEDDPERAVRCALELRRSLDEANIEIATLLRANQQLIAIEPLLFQQQIGINTGAVFAGRVGSALRHEYSVMGQPVNLAARLMGTAQPGRVVLSPSTRRVVEATIATQDLPAVQLKGIVEPVAIAEALYPKVADRQQNVPGVGRMALVGRQAELALLNDAVRITRTGSGRVVTLTGEMGIGKSRLIAEILGQLEAATEERPAWQTCLVECQSYDQMTPFATMRQVLIALMGLAGEPPQVARRTERLVANLAPSWVRFTPLLSDILPVVLPDTPLTQALSPEQRHERVLELIDALIMGMARAQPLAIAVDDLHWSDASSIELLARFVQLAQRAPLMLLFSYRQDGGFSEPWNGLNHCQQLLLSELDTSQSAELIAGLLGGGAPVGLERLLERTQGNPFFIEAVVRSLFEAGVLTQTEQGLQINRTISEIAIPDSVEGVITARLDRLAEPLRDTVQVAAVIGRRFAVPILEGVLPQQVNLIERLDRLYASDIVAPDNDEHEVQYQFTHALTRDVAYESILFARRRDLHRRVAQRIEAVYPEHLDNQIGLLARHYLVAEDWQRSLDCHLQAGRQAQERFANREAIAFFDRGLQICHELTTRGAPAADLTVVELYERLGAIHGLLGEYDTAEDRYEAALYTVQRSTTTESMTQVRLLYGIARVDEKRAQFEQAFERVEDALALCQGLSNQEHVRCLLLGGGLHQRLGRYPQAREWSERALAMAEHIQSERDQAEALLLLGGTYRNMGDNQRSFELTNRSLELFLKANDLGRVADAHNNLANICFDLGRLSDARVQYEAGAEIKQAIGDIYGQGLIACNLGEVFRVQGEIDAAIAQYAHALVIYQRIGSRYMMGVLHMNLGAAHLVRGDFVSAAAHLQPSTDLFAEIGAEDFLPELERHQAELSLRRGDLSEANRQCEQALATAIRLEARAEEGMTRRLLAEITASAGNPSLAWQELQRSQAILREAESPHELARTLVAIAALAPNLDQAAQGQAAIQEAIPLLEEIGALRDLEVAHTIAVRYPRA